MVVATAILVFALAAICLAVPVFAARAVRRHDTPRPDGLPTGGAVARAIIEAHRLSGVKLAEGDVDSYIASERTLQLADGRLDRASVSAVAIAAHEAAHVLQHREGYRPWRILWPLASVALLADFAIVVLLAVMLTFGGTALAVAILVLLALVAMAAIASMVVEVNATDRAISELRAQHLEPRDLAAARRVLTLAAAAYVAETAFDAGSLRRRFGQRQ